MTYDERYHHGHDPRAKEALQTLGDKLAEQMPEGFGFALLIFSFGEGGECHYLANGERETMASMMRELLAKWDREGGR